MLAYRILNSYDIKINPLKHGIYSKALIASVLAFAVLVTLTPVTA